MLHFTSNALKLSNKSSYAQNIRENEHVNATIVDVFAFCMYVSIQTNKIKGTFDAARRQTNKLEMKEKEREEDSKCVRNRRKTATYSRSATVQIALKMRKEIPK